MIKSTQTEVRAMVGFALNNTDKICSVPKDATAYYHRDERIDILVLVKWDNDAPGKKDEARRIAQLLVDVVVQNEEKPADAASILYGNTGASHHLRSRVR